MGLYLCNCIIACVRTNIFFCQDQAVVLPSTNMQGRDTAALVPQDAWGRIGTYMQGTIQKC